MSSIKIEPLWHAGPGLGRMFDDFFKGMGDWTGGSEAVSNMPSVNITENTDSFLLDIAAPGLEKDDFNINLEENTLTISAERSSEEKTKDEEVVRREFNYTSFQRSFRLPTTVDADKINASYNKGVLRLTIPKKEEAKQKTPRVIEIS